MNRDKDIIAKALSINKRNILSLSCCCILVLLPNIFSTNRWGSFAANKVVVGGKLWQNDVPLTLHSAQNNANPSTRINLINIPGSQHNNAARQHVHNSLDNTRQSNLSAFNAAPAAPGMPGNPSPGSVSSPGPTTSSSSVTLSWSGSSGATYYGVGVRDLATNVLVVDTNASGTSLLTNLSAGKQYRWNVNACNSAGCSSYTTPLYFQTLGAVSIPGTPSNPGPGSVSSPGPTTSSSSVTLSWSGSSGATYYGVGVRDIATNVLVVDTNASGTSYSANLTSGKQYRWNVNACNSAGCSSYTTPLYFQTPGTVSIPATPSNPSPGSASSPGPTTSSSSVTLSWSGSSGATYYGVGVRDIATNVLVVDTNANVTSYTANLSPGKQYRWNVNACNTAGCSSYTTPVYFQTPGTVSVPATPSNPSPGSISSPGPTTSSSSVTLSWNGSSVATSYGVGVRDIATNVLVVDTNAIGSSYTAILSAGKQYRWNVNACNSAGCSSYTASLYFQTPGTVSIPATPSNPSPGSVSSPGPTTSSSSVTLSWSGSSEATYYAVGVRDIATNVLVVDTNASGTSYTANLSPGKQYRWNVNACNSAGCSSYTTPLYFQTPGASGTSLSVAPNSAPLGTTFRFTGGGFTSNSIATLSVTRPDHTPAGGGKYNTESNGNVSFVITSQPTDPLGQWTFTLTDGAGKSATTTVQYIATQQTGSDGMSFIADLNVLDNTQITAGSNFTKTWRLKNSGTTTWNGYTAVFISNPNNGNPSINLNSSGAASVSVQAISPNQTVDLSISMKAPSPGTYYSHWQLQNASGERFGVQFYVKIRVVAQQGNALGFGTQSGHQGTNDSPPAKSARNADPVNTATGNYNYAATDLRVPGRGLDVEIARSYNSQDRTPGSLGNGWSDTFNIYLTNITATSASVHYSDGKVLDYVNQAGTNTFASSYHGYYDTLAQNSDGTWTLNKTDQRRYQFNQSGKLTAIQDRNNNQISLSYSGGNVSQVTDTVGRAFTFAYSGSLLTSITDPGGRNLQFTYDANSNLISFRDANGNTNTYSYDSNNQLLKVVDGRGNNLVINAYDSNNRVATQINGRGNPWSFVYNSDGSTSVFDPFNKESKYLQDTNFNIQQTQDRNANTQFASGPINLLYDENNNRAQTSDAKGNYAAFVYDQNGNITNRTDPTLNSRTATYDSKNNPTQITDELGKPTQMAYDSNGNLTTLTDAHSNSSSTTYDSFGEPLTATDASGNVTTRTYDAQGNLTSVKDVLNNTTTYTYDSVGRRTSVTNARGKTNRYTYDANDNLLTVTDPLNNVTTYTYDANNNRTSMTDGRGNRTAYIYDENNSLIKETDVRGNFIQHTYDKLDRRISTRDKRGYITTFTYDNEGRLLALTDPLNNQTSYFYDANGNRTKVTDAKGQSIQFTYDALNRVTRIQDALNNTIQKEYDATSRLTKEIDPRGNATQFSYDSIGNLTQVNDAATGTAKYAYDKNRNRIAQTDPNNHTSSLAYDKLNRLLSSADTLGHTSSFIYDQVGNRTSQTDAKGQTTSYTYDANDRLIVITYPDNSTVQFTRDANGNVTRMVDSLGTSNYVYDELNRLAVYTDPFGKSIGYQYDESGNIANLTYPDGKQVSYQYDANNRMASLSDWAGKTTTFQYDSTNLLTKVTYPNGIVSQMTYDNAGRLIAKSDSGISSYSFTLDKNGNRTSATITQPVGNRLQNTSQSSTFDAANRIQNVGPTTFGFDNNGNMISKTEAGSITNYGYDFENRLVSVSGSAQYFYNGLGVRLQKIEGAKTTRYVVDTNHDLSQVLSETDANGASTVYYVYGMGVAYKVNPDGTHYYYHFDPLGSTIALTNDSKNIVNSYAYDAFGEITNAVEHTSNPFKFVGQYGLIDDANGLLYVRARYYSPRLGRFLSIDPIAGKDANPQSLNRYAYAYQNPLLNVDPSGAVVFSLGIGGDAGIFLGVTGQVALVSDGQGHHGFALSGGTEASLQAGLSLSYSIAITNDASIYDLNGKSYSIGAGGGRDFIGFNVNLLQDSNHTVNGVSLSAGLGAEIGIGIGTTTTWGKVYQLSDWKYNLVLSALGLSAAPIRAFDAAVKMGNSGLYSGLIRDAAKQQSTPIQTRGPQYGPPNPVGRPVKKY